MALDPEVVNRPYNPPSIRMLDARAVKAELIAKGDSKDTNVRKMLSFIDKRLNERKAKSHSHSRPKP